MKADTYKFFPASNIITKITDAVFYENNKQVNSIFWLNNAKVKCLIKYNEYLELITKT